MSSLARSQSPYVRAVETHQITLAIAARPAARPIGIFVARRQQFDIEAERHLSGESILRWAFQTLPLLDHGWDRTTARVILVHEGIPHRLWRMERG